MRSASSKRFGRIWFADLYYRVIPDRHEWKLRYGVQQKGYERGAYKTTFYIAWLWLRCVVVAWSVRKYLQNSGASAAAP